MHKVAYNTCYGGFSLSNEAEELFLKLSGNYFSLNTPRHDKTLIEVIEELGFAASGCCSDIVIHVIKGDRYTIKEYDGKESVEEEMDWIYIETLLE